jgi:hypothetical protein
MIDTEKVSFSPNFKGVPYPGNHIPATLQNKSVTLPRSQRPANTSNSLTKAPHPDKHANSTRKVKTKSLEDPNILMIRPFPESRPEGYVLENRVKALIRRHVTVIKKLLFLAAMN